MTPRKPWLKSVPETGLGALGVNLDYVAFGALDMGQQVLEANSDMLLLVFKVKDLDDLQLAIRVAVRDGYE